MKDIDKISEIYKESLYKDKYFAQKELKIFSALCFYNSKTTYWGTWSIKSKSFQSFADKAEIQREQ